MTNIDCFCCKGKLLLLLLVSYCCFLWIIRTVEAVKLLKQIHVITRHGSRTTLFKDADTLSEESGPTLTPLGQEQLFKMGTWLRETYTNVTDDLLQLHHFNPSLHRLESSNLDRTLSSANALALGLFPRMERATGLVKNDGSPALIPSLLTTPPAIPVYAMQEENDVYLRAFQHCPAFHNNLQQLYETEDWKRLEKENEDLLRKMAAIFPNEAVDGRIPLKSVWNVYDPIHVDDTECAAAAKNRYSCDALVPYPSLSTALSEQEFAALELLTHRVEHMKFAGPETAGNLLGSNLLWKILQRVGEGRSGGSFYLYSAHAPTMLGFLATLQASESFVSASGGERFIDYGSALIVEVYAEINDNGEAESLHIKLKYKSLSENGTIEIALKEATAGTPCGQGSNDDDTAYCDVEKFSLWAIENTHIGTEHWCEACGNESADVCLRSKYLLDGENGESGDFGSSSSSFSSSVDSPASNNKSNSALLAVTFLSGILVGLLFKLFVRRACGFPTALRRNDEESLDIHNKEGPQPTAAFQTTEQTVSQSTPESTPRNHTNGNSYILNGDSGDLVDNELGNHKQVV